MHKSWSCYALIVLERADTQQILCYQNPKDTLIGDIWRLPGGDKIPGDTDPIQTLIKRTLKETGISLANANAIRKLSHTNTKFEEGRKRFSHSTRFYVVTITHDEYLGRYNRLSQLLIDRCAWRDTVSLLDEGAHFLDEHRAPIRLHFNL